MDNSEFRKNAYDMIYLTRCAINSEKPDIARVEGMKLDSLFIVCQKHILTAGAAFVLESVGIHDHDFTQAKEKAIRKIILLDAERKKILQRLEEEKIWYMPMKGVFLKDWYPKLGMRQMSDNDILCDAEKRKNVRAIMEELGFQLKLERLNVDEFAKPPIYNFEMHESFFQKGVGLGSEMYDYYADVKERLLKDEGNEYGYHFSLEDYYLFMLAHEYKHYSGSGTGVRSLVDTYVFLRKFNDTLDWDYIKVELDKLGISDFERQNRELSMKFFDPETLTEQERSLLDYYIFSGTYGTIQQNLEHSIQRNADGKKEKYIFQRLFPSMDVIKVYYPFFYRHKWLIPILWIYRPFKGLSTNRESLSAEMRYLKKRK